MILRRVKREGKLAFDRLPQQYSYPSSLDRLLSALAKSPHEDALDVLLALARRDSRFLARHDWAQAVIKVCTEKSGQTCWRWSARASWAMRVVLIPFTCRAGSRTSARNSRRSRKRYCNAIRA